MRSSYDWTPVTSPNICRTRATATKLRTRLRRQVLPEPPLVRIVDTEHEPLGLFGARDVQFSCEPVRRHVKEPRAFLDRAEHGPRIQGKVPSRSRVTMTMNTDQRSVGQHERVASIARPDEAPLTVDEALLDRRHECQWSSNNPQLGSPIIPHPPHRRRSGRLDGAFIVVHTPRDLKNPASNLRAVCANLLNCIVLSPRIDGKYAESK